MSSAEDAIPVEQRDLKAEDAKIAEVTTEGQKIFNDFLKRQKDEQFAKLDPQSKYEYYLKLFPDFARSSPVILRYITFGMFSEKAVLCYYKKCYEHPIKTDEDWCSHQANYVKYIYHFNTKIRGAELEKIWADTKQLLMEEVQNMAVERERIKKEREARGEANDAMRREAFKIAVTRAIEEAKARKAAEESTSMADTLANKIAELSISPAQTTLNNDVNGVD